MTWTVNSVAKIALAAALRTLLLGGSVKLYSSTPTLLATLPISGIVDNGDGTLTVSFTQDIAPVTAGTAARADYCNSAGTVEFTTTSVSTSAADVNLDDLALTTSKRINMSSNTLTLASMVES